MASGIYGRRVVEPTINDRTLFREDQYPVTGANRALTSNLETVWDKVNDAKAVLQKLEHRIEITEEAKKAEDLAFNMSESATKKKTEKDQQPASALRSTPTSKSKERSSTSRRTTTNRVGFNDPLVFYDQYDPLHGSNPGSSITTIHGDSASFIARDFRTNDFDLSRVSVRDRPGSSRPDTSGVSKPRTTEKLVNGVPAGSQDRNVTQNSEVESPLKGKVAPARVLNEHIGGDFAASRPKPLRPGRDLKAAGVATTVTHFDPKQVYKYLQKEGMRKNTDNKPRPVVPSSSAGSRTSIFLASPYAPHKRIDVVKEKKKLEQNPEALSRLKEKIQRQKQRSPSSVDGTSPGFKTTHREEDLIVPLTNNYNHDTDKPRMRKTAHGPAAPKYKGFSTAETRIRTPDGKVWKDGESNHPYIPPRPLQGEKKPKAVSSLFKPGTNKSKPPLTSGRLKAQSFNISKQNKSKNVKPVRKTGKICPDDPAHKKSLITPSSWREGQRVAESILGPPPKQPRKTAVPDKQRPNSPPTRDTDTGLSNLVKKSQSKPAKKSDIGNPVSAAAASKPASAIADPVVEEDNEIVDENDANKDNEFIDSNQGGLQQKKNNSSIKASIPTEKLSAEVRGILDDLHLSSSESEDEKEYDQPKDAQKLDRRPRGRSAGKHSLPKDPKESKAEKMQKVRHYDQNKVQQFIAKQKAERKRKKSQERKAQKEAQERKQKQLEELYRKQKEACAKKKSLEMDAFSTGKGRQLKSVDLATMQAMQKIDGILGQSGSQIPDNEDSDKENSQHGYQFRAKFDEKMSAFMDKLNQYDTATVPKTHSHGSKASDPRVTSAPPPPTNTNVASEFMQKLDRYLKDDTPPTAVSRVPVSSPPDVQLSPEAPVERETNLTVEDLGALGEASPRRPETAPTHWDKYGDPSGTYSPQYRQMMGTFESSPIGDQKVKQRSRVERIAALKAKADSLQDRIQTESRRLMDQPIVPIKPRLEEIDAILAKSGHGKSLPIQAWSPRKEANDFRDPAPQWQRSPRWDHMGTDIADGARTRGGLGDYSPSQLPGVAGLRQHVVQVEESKKETEAASRIQSAYRGHAVRQAMDSWKLPSGQSLTDVRRQVTSLSNIDDGLEKQSDGEQSISEGPLTSRSDDLTKPMKLRSVEEILKEMKSREYCVADPSPLEEFQRTDWTDRSHDRDEPRTDRSGLTDLSSRIPSAREDPFSVRDSDRDKPPWERTGGDKYSVVNVFTNKYLKALKKRDKDEKESHTKPHVENVGRMDLRLGEHEEGNKQMTETQKRPMVHTLPNDGENLKTSSRTDSLNKYSSRFDNTEDDASESLSSARRDLSSPRHQRSPRQDMYKSPISDPMRSQTSGRSEGASHKSEERPPLPTPTELLVGRVSYTSSEEDDKTVSSESKQPVLDKKESPREPLPFEEDISAREDRLYRPDTHSKSPPRLRPEGVPALSPRIERPKPTLAPLQVEKRYSPAALEQKMSAELNYQEAIEESLRHLTGVERTQGVSLAQQETVSLAQLMKARQLQHQVEMERLTMKAKEDALVAERMKCDQRTEEENKRAQESTKMQEAARKTLETQAEAARSTAEAAKRLAHVLDKDAGRRKYDDYSTFSSERSKTASYTTSESVNVGRKEASTNSSGSASTTFEAPVKTKPGDKKSGKAKDEQWSPPSLMSEHSTTSVRPSDNDTQSSIPELVPSTEEEEGNKGFKKLDLNRSSASDSSTTKSITEELSVKRPADDTDKSISEDIEGASVQSSVKEKLEKGPTKKKQTGKDAKGKKEKASDSSEMSVSFDETLTEDEIAEISRRVVVPSESHRRHQRRRSPHTSTLDRSDISSDDQPASARQKTPRGGSSKVSLDDFSIGPALAGAADSEFAQFMDQMVRQYMLEEQVRAKHQAAMLKLRERAIKEKSETELSCLEQLKKQVRNKGEDDKMPPIKKKQRAILLRLKIETDEIKKLRAVTKAASQERKLFLQQHKENAARRAKLKAAEEKLDIETGLAKAKGRPEDGKEPLMTSSTPIPNTSLPEPPDVDDVSESNSELDLSSASSILLKKLKKPSAFDQRKLTKREQRLLHRKKQAEQLIAWKKRLDHEEKKVYDIEKQALSAWEKDKELKLDRTRPTTASESPRKHNKEREKSDTKLALKEDSSHEESSSVKSPESEHHSSPPPPSHSESSIAEELIQSRTTSSRSAVSPPVQDVTTPRNQEESSDGTNADDYTQSFESVNTSHRSPRSPRTQHKQPKQEKPPSVSEPTTTTKKEMKKEPARASESDLTPSSTPLLQGYSKSDKPSTAPPTKASSSEKAPLQRRESAESWSDESFSQTQSETEQSDIECRVRALKEELKRRRLVAERLKKEQKRRHKDRLKAQEASLRSQIDAYDVFIKKTQNELAQELDNQLNAAPASTSHLPAAKPQIRSPRKSDQARQAARALRSATAVVSPEASPRSGSHRAPAAVSLLGKNRTESESSGKSSRSLSFDDEERTADDATPNGSTKSFSVGVVGHASPLPSKHQDKLPSSHSAPSIVHHESISSGASTASEKKPLDRPKRLDLTDAAATLSKLTKPLSPNGFTPTASPASSTASQKARSLIPIASKATPATAPPPKVLPPVQQTKKSLIPIPVLTSSTESITSPPKLKEKEKVAISPPSPLPSEKSLTYSEDFESSAGSKKNQEEGSIATDDDISEHFSDASTGTSKSDHSGALLDLSAPVTPKVQDLAGVNKDDTLQEVEDIIIEPEVKKEEEEDDEKTPVASPVQTPVPSSPRTPTSEKKDTEGRTTFEIGDRVLLAGREPGIVRYIGETKFAPGIWVGAELQHPAGKNDGSVNDVRYFTCTPKFGIFAPLSRVEMLSPRSQSTSARSSLSHFEYDEEADRQAFAEEEKSSTESETSKVGSDGKSAESGGMEFESAVTPPEEILEKPSSPVKTGPDRNRLADELSDKLLNSLLQDSVSNILDSHTNKKKRQNEEQEDDEDVKRKKLKDDQEEVQKTGSESSDEDDVALSASTRNLLEMLATSPDQMAGDMVEDEDEEEIRAKAHESLADTFTGDLLKDTLTKVLEIRRQRAIKWMAMAEEEKGKRRDAASDEDASKPRDVDNGREVEDILLQEAKSLQKLAGMEPGNETDRDSVTPARPVSPIFGASQDDVLEEWFDEDFGISAFHKKKPIFGKDEEEGTKEEEDFLQDGRLIEVLSSRIEPPPPPPKFVIPHRPEHILRLVEDAVGYFYTKHLRGDLKSDVRIPDFLYQDQPGEVSDDEKESDEVDQEKKEAAKNTDHVFKTSLFDMVREIITEIYSSESSAQEASKRPLWLKKKSVTRPSYCRKIPKTADELLKVVSDQVCKLLNVHGDALKLDPKITMKWGTRKKKDKVDIILIQELREEEPEWTNYDEDETTVKMQLTDTVLDMLLSDTVRCLDDIERKRKQRLPDLVVPTATDDNSQSNDERSQ